MHIVMRQLLLEVREGAEGEVREGAYLSRFQDVHASVALLQDRASQSLVQLAAESRLPMPRSW